MERLSGGEDFLTELHEGKNYPMPKIVVVPDGPYVTIRESEISMDADLKSYLVRLLLNCGRGLDFNRESAELVVDLYLKKKLLEREICRKADDSMRMVSEWRNN